MPRVERAAPAPALRWEQVMAWRLRRHHLDRRAPAAAMLQVVSDLCGLHAQLASSAELTLWARVDGLAPGAVGDALWRDRTLVKTWAMRGTLHLLPAAEYPLWQAGLSTRWGNQPPSWFRGFGVTPAEMGQLLAAVPEALDGRMLTREELAAEVARLSGSAKLGDKVRHSWGSLLKPAAFLGRLCFAPSQGQNVRFTRPDTWLGGWSEHDPEEAMLEITRRWLAASGPVGREDLARWWAMTPATAGRHLERLAGEVTTVVVEGTDALMLGEHAAGAARAAAEAEPSVRLLPAFDQYVVTATRHAAHLLPGPFRDRVYRPQGWLSPVLLVNGRMDGVWRHQLKGRRVLVTVEPFVDLPAWARAAAEEEAERLAAHLGGTLDLEWSQAGEAAT